MNFPAWALVPLAPLAFVGFWCFVCWLISMGGWNALASRYRTVGRPYCNVASMQSGFINSARYKGALGVGACDSGLYLEVMFLFRTGHPPLLIPWDKLSSFEESKVMWSSFYTTSVEVSPSQRVRISFYDRALVERIQAKMSLTSVT